MYGDTDRGGATTALRFVTCDLSSLTDCGCMSASGPETAGSSSKRKCPSKPSPLIDTDSLTPFAAKRLILGRPSLIDRLILRNKSALEEMEGKKRGPKSTPTQVKTKEIVKDKDLTKRKRTESMNGTSPAIKRLRSSKGGSDSDSSPSRIPSTERKRGRPPLNKNSCDKTDKSSNKNVDKKQSPKKPTRKSEKSRFSKRLCFPTTALRSGKKRQALMESLLNRKRIAKSLSKESKEKRRWPGSDKTDSNSNVCTENDSNDETMDASTDSEVSRGALDTSDLSEGKSDKPKNPDDEGKKRRKRRKRDSMWVKKIKKQIKSRTDSSEKSRPPPLDAEEPLNKMDDEDDESDIEDTDLPILDKESDDSINVDNIKENIALNSATLDEVAMPKLEKEVDVPLNKKSDDNVLLKEVENTRHFELPLKKLDTFIIDRSNKTKIIDSITKDVKSNSPDEKKMHIDEKSLTQHFNKVQNLPETLPNCVPKDSSEHPNEVSPKTVTEDLNVKIDSLSNSECKADKPLESPKDSNAIENESLVSIARSELASTEHPELVKNKPGELACDEPEKSTFNEPIEVVSDRIAELVSSDSDKLTSSMPEELIGSESEELIRSKCDELTGIQSEDLTEELPGSKTEEHTICKSEELAGSISNELSVSVSEEVISTQSKVINDSGQNVTRLESCEELKLDILPSSSHSEEIVACKSPEHDINTSDHNTRSDEHQEVSDESKHLNDKLDEMHVYKVEQLPDSNTKLSCDIAPFKMTENLKDCKLEEILDLKSDGFQDTKSGVLLEDNLAEFNEGSLSIENNLLNETEQNKSCSINESEIQEELKAIDDFMASSQEKIIKSEPNLSDSDMLVCNESRETDIKHDSKYLSKLPEHIIHKIENIEDSQCESTDVAMESSMDIKDVSLLDADSTSDVKNQSLDDSFGDFSLSLPEDLDLESSPSDDDREESDEVFPDSTECDRLEDTSQDVSPPNDSCSIPIVSNENREQHLSETLQQEVQKEIAQDNTKDSAILEKVVSVKRDEPLQKEIESPAVDPGIQKNDQPSTQVRNEELTNEQRQMKESVLQALGLKSLTTQPPEEKPKRDGYTGTLKAVIKLNRSGDKKRMVYQRTEDSLGELEYRICSEIPATEGVPITHLNDIAGIRKNVTKLHQDSDINVGTATSNGHSEDSEGNSPDESKGASGGKESNLIIPEKSSSFSIHPGRLCNDVCSYCFGKFGCLDTPCHVAQLKSERQKKILENEPHLTADSCLCDACYRYVDRKANCPSKSNSGGSSKRVKPPASSQCCVNLCSQPATHTVKKKWLIKLKKSITNKLDIDLDKPGAMYFPLCAQHHYWVDYFTVCGICRKRLNRNHLFSLGSETDRLNLMLAEDGIPARLSDKLFLCKLCRYYSNLRLKYADPASIPSSGQIFYRDYRRKILMSLDIPVSDSEDEPASKEEKKKPSVKNISGDINGSSNGAASSKSDESVMSLSNLATLLGEQPEQQARIQVKFGNVNIGRLSNLNIGQGGRSEERLPYSEVGLQANLEFEGPVVPDGSWERCVSTIQFDKRTKKLWQDLQKPYGNQSSFLRHLVMLEKYWRAGHLSITPNADERAAKYLNGVKNRIKAFEGNSSGSEKPVPSQSAAPSVSTNDKFPLLTNTGEIEVTPIKTAPIKRPVSTSTPLPPEKKQMTPLDRAKSLVRMIPPTQRFPMPMQRYSVPAMFVPAYYPPQQRPPPLLKIRNKMIPQHYFHPVPQSLPNSAVLKPILPKLPKALTVTQVPPAITLNRSGITIEKQSGNPVAPTLPIEKPSISVFREPAPGPP